jgi:hypothetical protein
MLAATGKKAGEHTHRSKYKRCIESHIVSGMAIPIPPDIDENDGE